MGQIEFLARVSCYKKWEFENLENVASSFGRREAMQWAVWVA